MKNVLIIEDDSDLAELISIHLEDLGCKVSRASTGDLGYEIATKNKFDLVILDIMLPGIDGLEVCRRLHASDTNWPILILSAKSEEIDKVLGLETGADDYLTKPFSVREFIARVKSVFRRSAFNALLLTGSAETISIGNLTIGNKKRRITLNGNRIELTRKEFDLLQLLAMNPGKSYRREDLLNQIWGHEFAGHEHTVNSHINRLRSKIEPDFAKPRYILTTWGIGYRFNDELIDDN